MLEVIADYKLLVKHIETFCNEDNNKLRAIARVTSYMSAEKNKIRMNSFLMHTVTTDHLYGCYTVAEIIIS